MWWDEFKNYEIFLWLPGKSDVGGTRWLPLWVHLEDTAGVMDMLIREWLPTSICDQISSEADIASVCRFIGQSNAKCHRAASS